MNLPALRAQLRDPSFRQGASDMLGAGLGVGAVAAAIAHLAWRETR